MLFLDLIRAKDAVLNPECERIFELALANQNHSGDLLLLLLNGSHNPDILNFPGPRLSPYVVGPGAEGWAYQTHYQFINQYRHNIHNLPQAEYVASIQQLVDQQNWAERDRIEGHEAMTIHLETLIYLKVWESDFFIKRWYELVRLLLGEPFDWHFRVTSTRDPTATGARHEVIRLKIRDKVRPASEVLYEAIHNSYKSQVRNSIAHSNFSMQGRYLQLNNFKEGDPTTPLRALSFDDWSDMFHTTMALYNEVIGLMNRIHAHYEVVAGRQHNDIEVLVPDTSGRLRPVLIMYRPEFRDFTYKQRE